MLRCRGLEADREEERSLPVRNPTPNLGPEAPLEVIDAQTLFASGSPRRRHFGGLAVTPSGRIVLTFMLGSMPRKNDGAVMVATSGDEGRSWTEPQPLFAVPSWDCFPQGGPCPISSDHLRLFIGKYRFAPDLGGKQPFSGDWVTYYTDSHDEGETWSEPADELRLFPSWTEMYGASNPHPLADGRLLWAVCGTMERDKDWQSGVSFTDAAGEGFTEPVVIGAASGLAYSDGDVVRLDDGRLLAVIREHAVGDTLFSHSDDDGHTWSPLRPTEFVGANFKLNRLRSGAVTCLYRDEDPTRRGVSLSVSTDGGESWKWVGQLYEAPPDARHDPGYFCGCPDLEPVGNSEYAGVLHTYPDADDEICLHFFRLRDLT